MGTWPIEPGQAVAIAYSVEHRDGHTEDGKVDAVWRENRGPNSYWAATLGPFPAGAVVTYTPRGAVSGNEISAATSHFRVGPKLYLAILWHQHQPIYRDTTHRPAGSYRQPWVRLHALRDYYSMAALVGQHPDVHLTFNLTPVLVWQIEDYVEHGGTDRALDLTLQPAETLSEAEREELLASFFEADWHNQIFPHARYKELFLNRQDGRAFTSQDVRDVQMWFNLAWFGQEFREGEVTLATGETASVRQFIGQSRDFRHTDVEAMVREQFKIMRAIVPLHAALQARGQIEVSTSPFYHPILALLIDTDHATVDRPGAHLPPRFAFPEDAAAQVRSATEWYVRCFGRPPRGMWPAEGAVSPETVPVFAVHGIQWIATDRGVLARSGRWGYDVANPDVLCQPYRVQNGEATLSVFFRDTALSDAIGFDYHRYGDYEEAARQFLAALKERFAYRMESEDDRVLSIILDGENAWGAYREDARPFLHALYSLLERDAEIQTVTFAEYLEGIATRNLQPHPSAMQSVVHNLFTGSWIDENGSAPGVDLGTWIGEDEENRAWTLLGQTREALRRSGATASTATDAFEALYAAEGSDWFWWFGADQESGNDEEFDDLFRMHLRTVHQRLGCEAPRDLDTHIVPHAVIWTFAQPVARIQPRDRLTIRVNCPGIVTWRLDGGASKADPVVATGGVMAGVRRHHLTLGPFSTSVRVLRFTFRCTHRDCDRSDICCAVREHVVRIGDGDHEKKVIGGLRS